MNFSLETIRLAIRKLCWRFGYDVIRLEHPGIQGIQDGDCYLPLFSPWASSRFFPDFEEVANLTLCTRYSAWALIHLLRQTCDVEGEIVELGVYKGGMSLLIERTRASFGKQKPLRLFDTFAGMPDTDPVLDRHRKGDFSDTSLESVKQVLHGAKNVFFHEGLVEDTLQLADISGVSFVHIDLDIYSAIKTSIEYFWPRLSAGGIVVFDDYGYPTCPGARKAVDEFFANLPEKPFLLPFGSCFVQKRFINS